jgi:hypothetical protein
MKQIFFADNSILSHFLSLRADLLTGTIHSLYSPCKLCFLGGHRIVWNVVNFDDKKGNGSPFSPPSLLVFESLNALESIGQPTPLDLAPSSLEYGCLCHSYGS